MKSSIARFLFRSTIATAVLMASPLVSAAPTAQLSASRTSGTAPLAVFFDSTATTDSISTRDTFRELGYQFNFGDPNAGTWKYSSLSKNLQTGGPLAAHVFETPGTYTVKVTAKDATGQSSSTSVTITVQSADSYYAGTNTVCISSNTDFTGCPAEAQQLPNSTTLPAVQSNKRYLLHRGQSFAGQSVRLGTSVKDAQVGAFGTGAKPVVGGVSVAGSGDASLWTQRNVIMDLSVAGLKATGGAIDLLAMRLTSNAWFETDGNKTVASVGPGQSDLAFFVENEIDPSSNADTTAKQYGFTASSNRLALLGNRVGAVTYHNVRLWQGYKNIVAHNSLSGKLSQSGYHALKIHAEGLDDVSDGPFPNGPSSDEQRTKQIVVADNVLGDADASPALIWTLAVCPQNDQSAEGIEDLIIEDNSFPQNGIYVAGRRITTRGNSRPNGQSLKYSNSGCHEASLPTEWKGPYYVDETTMKSRFDSKQPEPPQNLSVQ